MAGYGNVASGFLQGLQAANGERRKDELSAQKAKELDMRAQYQSKQMEVMDANLKAAKRQEAAANSPQAKQLKAAQAQASLMEAQVKTQAYTMVGQDMGMSQVQNEVAQVKQQVEDKIAIDANNEVVKNYSQTLADGERITDLKPLNNLIAGNPAYQTVAKNPLIFYNDADPSHVQGIQKAAQKTLKLQGIDLDKMPNADYLMNTTVEMLKSYANRGYIVADSQTGEMVPLSGIFNLSGSENVIPESTKKKMQTSLQNTANEAANTEVRKSRLPSFNSTPEWKNPESPKNQKQLYKGKDPAPLLNAYKMSGMTPPAELVTANTKNQELVKAQEDQSYFAGATQGQVIKTMDRIKEEALGGNLSEDSTAILKSGIEVIKDPTLKKDYAQVMKIAENGAKVDKIYTDPTTVSKPEYRLSYIESDNLKGNSTLSKQRDLVSAQKVFVGDLNGAMDTIVRVTQPGEAGIATGVFAPTLIGMYAKDKAASDKALDIIEKGVKFITGDGEVRYKIDSKQLLNSIDVNTQVGSMIAKYVKATSGSGVSDGERQYLTAIITAANNGDPQAMVRAMQSFRDLQIDGLDKGREDLVSRNALPYTYYDVNTLDRSDKVSQVGNNFSTTSGKQTSPQGAPVGQQQQTQAQSQDNNVSPAVQRGLDYADKYLKD